MDTNTYTIRSLLEELRKNLPKFAKGQIFETLISIYPSAIIPKAEKNIVLNEAEVTKPFAADRRTKTKFIKQKSPFSKFFREYTRGDFLKVIRVDENKAYCINLSLKPAIRKKYYKKPIEINYNDLLHGNLKLFKRKVTKYIKEE